MRGDHLSLVPPSPQAFPFDMECFAFALIGDDIFVCHKGVWNLAADFPPAREALEAWTKRINAQLPDEVAQLRWPVRA